MNDLLRQKPAMPPALTKPRTQTDNAIGIAFARNGPHQRCTINGIGDRPVDHGVNAHVHQGRHPCKGTFEHIADPIKIIGAQRVDKMGINPVHAPCFALLLIKPDKQAVFFLTAIIIADRAAQQWHPVARIRNSWNFFGQEILMLHRHHRMVYPHHRAHFVDTVPTGVDHNITGNIALFGSHRPSIIRMLLQSGHGCVAVNLSAGFAGAARQCLTKLRRINIPIQRIP